MSFLNKKNNQSDLSLKRKIKYDQYININDPQRHERYIVLNELIKYKNELLNKSKIIKQKYILSLLREINKIPDFTIYNNFNNTNIDRDIIINFLQSDWGNHNNLARLTKYYFLYLENYIFNILYPKDTDYLSVIMHMDAYDINMIKKNMLYDELRDEFMYWIRLISEIYTYVNFISIINNEYDKYMNINE